MSIITLVTTCLWFLHVSRFAGASQANVNCLRSIKSQVIDPNEYLSSWVFGNNTEGYICKFTGVTCWHDDENRVLSIKICGFGLTGKFPLGLKKCSELSSLDLSRNNFSGPLPPNIASLIPSVTTLDLSYNSFSGEIPLSVSNITYLNALLLQHNQFTGLLPPQLVLLGRLNQFSVADNRLTGPIPNFNTTTLKLGPDAYANNPGLCGKPLDACHDPEEEMMRMMIRLGKMGAAVGAVVLAPVGAAIGWFFFNGRKEEKQRVIQRRSWVFHIED